MAQTISSKQIYVDYEDLKALDFNMVKTNLNFPMKRENIKSVESDRVLNKSVLFRTNLGDDGSERKLIGYINEKRTLIPYVEMMDWITDEISKVSEFKLVSSSVQGKQYKMYQKYVLNQDIENPDGEKLSPMLNVIGSYTGVPLVLDFATFRYICSNGASVKVEDFGKMSVSVNDVESLKKTNISDMVKRGLDNMYKVSNKYKDLASKDWKSYLINLLTSPNVPVSVKKAATDHLINNNELNQIQPGIIKGETYLGLKDDGLFLSTREGNPVYQLTCSKSAWDFYNDCTNISTHRSPSEAIQRATDGIIANLFLAN